MGNLNMEETRQKVASQFAMEGTLKEVAVFGNGHINDTLRATCELPEGGTKRYIVQRMSLLFCVKRSSRRAAIPTVRR